MEHELIVYARPTWLISYNARRYDHFSSRDEAVMRAMQWAENARAQGHKVRVLLEDQRGTLQPVFDSSETPPDLRERPPAPARADARL
jgi:hypothetical protein